MVAAKRLAVSDTAHTMLDVLEGRALGHYAEGLRQYLAVRLGQPEQAQRAFSLLKEQVAQVPMESLAKPPGVRARLYRMARGLAQGESGEVVKPAPKGTLPWYRPAEASVPYLTCLRRVREELTPEQAELLELRHARELSASEIAIVLERSEDEVRQQLVVAEATARGIVGDRGSMGLPKALLEAFALDRDALGRPTSDPRAQDPREVPLGTIVGERYRLEKLIGSGGFANVYKAADTEVEGHVVALKLLHRRAESDDAKAHALRELQIIASVFHPSIVQFKDHGWHDGRLWFVMPWYEGESLEDRIQRQPLTRAEAKRIFVPLARALAALHAAGIRHQDVKPDNIFLTKVAGFEEGELPVLLDLGVAAKEAELVIAGTPEYLAPEVAAQFAQMPTKHGIGSPSDVFALALTLRNALEPSTAQQVAGGAMEWFIVQRARGVPGPPKGKDARYLASAFRRWMALDPTERPSADELADELGRMLTLPEERKARRSRVLRWAIPIVSLIVLTVLAIVWFYSAKVERVASKVELLQGEADLARQEAQQEEELRQQLEREVDQAQERYRSSQLTRSQLASKLGETEGALAQTRRNLSHSRSWAKVLTDRLADARTQLDDVTRLYRQEQNRSEELSARAERSDAEATSAREDLQEVRAELQTRTQEVASLEQQVSAAQNNAQTLEQQVTRLEGEVRVAQQDRARFERELSAAQARIRELERLLAAARRGAGGGAGGSGSGGGGSGGGGSGGDTGGEDAPGQPQGPVEIPIPRRGR